jgi:hypothetical protein
MKLKYAATLAAAIMVVSAFAFLATADNDADVATEVTPLDLYQRWQMGNEFKTRKGIDIAATNVDHEVFGYVDGPYPQVDADGSPQGIEWPAPAAANNFVSDIYVPPTKFQPGGGNSIDATGAAGDYTVGDTHESSIGDQNGDGAIEWISYFCYKPWMEDGRDNDGDGLIDEAGGTPGGVGIHRTIPDCYVYWGTGGLPDAGGDDGDLLVLVDWYTKGTTDIFRAQVSAPWIGVFTFRTTVYYPQMAGDFVSYYAHESWNGVNANPERDSDQSDWYVGNIDARGFPAIPPTDTACSAGYQLYMGITYLREDGYVVTSYELWESQDANADWNGDGDSYDDVAAYYVVDPVSGNCRQGVNGGVFGWYPRNAGSVMSPGYTWESSDSRDWNGDGDTYDTVLLWHNIDARSDLPMSWPLVGPVYTSSSYTSVGAMGNGWWGRYATYGQFQTFPMKFGGSYYVYHGYPTYYRTWFFLTADEDNSRTSTLPRHLGKNGQPGASPCGTCIQIYSREYYLQYANIDLLGTIADGNGDGDTSDTIEMTFCPDETGGTGEWLEEETSKYAKGMYTDPGWPYYTARYVYYAADGTAAGHTTMPGFYYETSVRDDANDDGRIGGGLWNYYHQNYQFMKQKPDFEITELEWADGGYLQPGGTVLVRMTLLNIGGMPIKIKEDSGIETIPDYKIQGMSAVDLIGPDGVIVPGEVATFYFAMTVSAGAGAGILGPANLLWMHEIEFFVSYGGVTKSVKLKLPVYLKMFGNHLACYRHKQNALRTMRAWDMDDDTGPMDMAKYLAHGGVDPEADLLLAISWFENGCHMSGQNDVEGAHSFTASLTGSFGNGMQYWGFAPGQEEGNEGNGNGGLTGQDRKAAYGF